MARLTHFLSFRPLPVTLLFFLTYLAILLPHLYLHHSPPSLPSTSTLASYDIDLTSAWSDLQELTKSYRPYNSHRNDEISTYILTRINSILSQNQGYGYDGPVDVSGSDDTNVWFDGERASSGLGVYFEGTNIVVHIHGADESLSPVLVNAHYDSVSTGYGATDDGKAVVAVLQVVKAFTSPRRAGGNRIKRGIIALLNNGEEDFLNGARAFAVGPYGNRSHMFLNLEGAGAGGRATLFRSTDTEVTRFYGESKHPFGTVVSGDGFKKGMIRSQTDYKVFVENLGMRGLDVAYWMPRSRYHTEDDDVRHTSKESLWHMLEAALGTLEAMTRDTTGDYDKEGEERAGRGTEAVWFDLFGRTLAVFRLHTLFALTITLIVVPFVIITATLYGLYASNKLYMFSNTPLPPSHASSGGNSRSSISSTASSSSTPTTTRGWRGFFRFPIAITVATAANIGLAYFLEKTNPMIAYSSEYSVWAMFLSSWFILVWFILRGADAIRPTALGRGYALLQSWVLWFIILIGVAVTIQRQHLASGYFILFIYAGAAFSAWLGLLELTALPAKPSCGSSYEQATSDDNSDISDDEDRSTERSPLFRPGSSRRQYGSYHRSPQTSPSPPGAFPHHDGSADEAQPWSHYLPTALWIPQFLLSVPPSLLLTIPLALLFTSALNQTGADGGSMLPLYLFISILSAILLLPATPYFSRLPHHLALFLLPVLIGTMIYNSTAFPFSQSSRLKVYFQQSINLDTSETTTALIAHPRYVKGLVADYLPSAHNAELTVIPSSLKSGLTTVSWPGLSPKISPVFTNPAAWAKVNATSPTSGENGEFAIEVFGLDTRNCKLLFSRPVEGVKVERVGRNGLGVVKTLTEVGRVKEVRLWKRVWGGQEGWRVKGRVVPIDDIHIIEKKVGEKEKEEGEVKGDGEGEAEKGKLKGRVFCMWAEQGEGRIPGLEEVKRFLPEWAVVSKYADGLVEGWKEWSVGVRE